MRLNLFTDYALRLMLHLASEQSGHRTTIAQASRALNLPFNHLAKVAHRLAKAQLVTPSQGRNGGLVLSRPASEITIGQVLRVTEPDFALATCMAGRDCSVQEHCGLGHVLDAALIAFFRVVDKVNFADLSQKASGRFSPPAVVHCKPSASQRGLSGKHPSSEG
jgi:Rrf2 family nitric oxide-sensitive transcriptional repressor